MASFPSQESGSLSKLQKLEMNVNGRWNPFWDPRAVMGALMTLSDKIAQMDRQDMCSGTTFSSLSPAL